MKKLILALIVGSIAIMPAVQAGDDAAAGACKDKACCSKAAAPAGAKADSKAAKKAEKKAKKAEKAEKKAAEAK